MKWNRSLEPFPILRWTSALRQILSMADRSCGSVSTTWHMIPKSCRGLRIRYQHLLRFVKKILSLAAMGSMEPVATWRSPSLASAKSQSLGTSKLTWAHAGSEIKQLIIKTKRQKIIVAKGKKTIWKKNMQNSNLLSYILISDSQPLLERNLCACAFLVTSTTSHCAQSSSWSPWPSQHLLFQHLKATLWYHVISHSYNML